MLNPTGLIRGHYECRSFDQTLPILNNILGLEVVREKNGEKTLKHTNTDWRLVSTPTDLARPSNQCAIITARSPRSRSHQAMA
jgi:hypothetical protein